MLLPSLVYGCTAYLIQKINNGLGHNRPHIFCARRTSNKGWAWLQFSSCEAVGMFQAAARNYDLTLKIGYPRLPIIHMDYPQLSPLQMEILSEKPPCFYLRRQEQVRGLVQIQSSCCAFAALQEDGSVISWGHPSMPQKMAEFAESMILFFLADFPHLFLGNPWKSTRNPLENRWIPGGLCFVFFWGGSWISKIQGQRPKDWCCQLPGKTPSRPSSRLPMPLQRCWKMGVSLPGATRIMEEILGTLGILGLVWDNDG